MSLFCASLREELHASWLRTVVALVRARTDLARRQRDGTDPAPQAERLRECCFQLHEVETEAGIFGIDPAEFEAALDSCARGLLCAARGWLRFVNERHHEEHTDAWRADLADAERVLFAARPEDEEE